MENVESIMRLLFEGAGVALIAAIFYFGIYYVKKYNLEKWVVRAVNAAEIMFDISGDKKQWVLKFLRENGFTNGVSEAVVDALIEAAVNELNLQQGKISDKSQT